MAAQFSEDVRNDWIDDLVTRLGSGALLDLRTGDAPANCAASATGTLVAQIALPTTYLTTPSGGSASLSGTWEDTSANNSGTVGHYRMTTSGGTCKHQGAVSQAFKLTTNATTAANSNVLKFSSASGVTAGMSIYGTGVPTGATVLGVSGGDVTMSAPSTSGVTSSTDVYFGDVSGQLWLVNTAITATQPVTITAWSITMGGA